jgi:hypothetical protein
MIKLNKMLSSKSRNISQKCGRHACLVSIKATNMVDMTYGFLKITIFWDLMPCSPVQIEERKRPLGRPRRRWVENIKIDLKRDRIGGDGMN